MRRNVVIRQNSLLVVYVILLSLLIGGLSAAFVFNHQKMLEHEEARQVDLEMKLVSEFITDSLIRHDYAEIREFLDNWSQTRVSVRRLKAQFENGFVLVDYNSGASFERMGTTVTRDLKFGNTYLRLVITRDATFLHNVMGSFKNELLIQTVFIVLVIGVSLWYILTKFSINPMEKELLQRTEALAASEQLYKSITSNIPNGAVMLFNSSMRCLFAEGQGLGKISLRIDQIKGRSVDAIFDSGSAYKIRELLIDAISGKQVDDDVEIEDKTMWFHAIPIPSDKNRSDRILVLIQDVTESKELMKEIVHSREQAEKANRVKSEFLANMSHEIRTPMNAIMGYTELLKSERDEKYKKDYLLGITSAGKNLLAIINDILDLSKIESGKLSVTYTPVSIKDISTDIITMFRALAEDKGLGLSIVLDDKLPDYVYMDETRLNQIIVNIVGNAIKFTSHGYVELSVSCDKKSEGVYSVIFKIKDTGVGIAPEQIDKIFESFTQQDGQDTRKFGGTGLGLTITKKLTDMMNGRISVESECGKGSVFTVEFEHLKSAVLNGKSNQDSALSDIDFEPATVLVVDDVESNRAVIKNFLRNYSVTVIEAENGLEGVNLAKKLLPDVILMDIQMPLMDGYKASAKIKNIDKLTNVPIVAVTASVYGSDNRVREKMDSLLSKPFTKVELVDELIKYLPYKKLTAFDSSGSTEIDYSLKAISDSDAEEISSQFGKRYDEVSSLMINQDVEQFANDLMDFSDKKGIIQLRHFAENLKDLVSAFKIGEIENRLKEFGREIITKGEYNGKK